MALSNASAVLGCLHAALSSALAADASHTCTLEKTQLETRCFLMCGWNQLPHLHPPDSNDYRTHTLTITLTITTPVCPSGMVAQFRGVTSAWPGVTITKLLSQLVCSSWAL